MNSRRGFLALAAVGAALCVPTGATASRAAPGRGVPTMTLQLLDISTSSASTIPDNQQPKLGDRFASRDELYRWKGAKRGAHVGYANVSFVALGPQVAQLSAVGYLPGGTIAIFGDNIFSRRTNTFAVIGGTGIYATARGELTARGIGGGNSNKIAITIRLWLTR